MGNLLRIELKFEYISYPPSFSKIPSTLPSPTMFQLQINSKQSLSTGVLINSLKVRSESFEKCKECCKNDVNRESKKVILHL